jgi:phage/plasmid-like protein (TIGR03299 family)
MSHEVESMMYVGQTPWHKLGKKVDEGIKTAAAIIEAGLDWGVEAIPLFTSPGHGSQKVPERAIMRTKDQSILGVVGPNYVPLQNTEAFKFFDPFVDANEAMIDSAGSLRKGSDIWVLARLNRAPIDIGPGDSVEKYLLLSNSHRGGISVRVGFTPIRVVCANTLAMATNDKRSSLIRVIHGRQMKENLDKVQEVVNAANAQFEATAEQYRYLASKQIVQEDLKRFVKVIFVQPGLDTQRRQAREDKMIETITRLFETGKGHDLKSAKGTYWGAYNAATEYLAHERTKDDDKRLHNLWFGSGNELNKTAFKTAMAMAAGG